MALLKPIGSLLLLQFAFSLVDCKWIDMSHVYDNKTLAWGTMKSFKYTVVFDGSYNKNVPYLLLANIEMSEHSGTHVDAPLHFAKGKWSVDQIPLEKLVGQAIVVDISAKASKDPNAQVTVADLANWEKKHGRIPDDSILLVLSGWGKKWPNYEKYFGTSSKNDSLYQFPSIDANASQWLVDNRKIRAIGIDTASIDSGPSKSWPSHQILYARNIFGLENVANIDKLPAKGATIYVMPMKLKGGSGAPARIFANTDGAVGRSSKIPFHVHANVLIILGAIICLM